MLVEVEVDVDVDVLDEVEEVEVVEDVEVDVLVEVEGIDVLVNVDVLVEVEVLLVDKLEVDIEVVLVVVDVETDPPEFPEYLIAEGHIEFIGAFASHTASGLDGHTE